jgi:hypothetical protein
MMVEYSTASKLRKTMVEATGSSGQSSILYTIGKIYF